MDPKTQAEAYRQILGYEAQAKRSETNARRIASRGNTTLAERWRAAARFQRSEVERLRGLLSTLPQ